MVICGFLIKDHNLFFFSYRNSEIRIGDCLKEHKRSEIKRAIVQFTVTIGSIKLRPQNLKANVRLYDSQINNADNGFLAGHLNL